MIGRSGYTLHLLTYVAGKDTPRYEQFQVGDTRLRLPLLHPDMLLSIPSDNSIKGLVEMWLVIFHLL